jgi:hypothetical protein
LRPFFTHGVRYSFFGHFTLRLRAFPALVDVKTIVVEVEGGFGAGAFDHVVTFNAVAGKLHQQSVSNFFPGSLAQIGLNRYHRIFVGSHELTEILHFFGLCRQ